MNAIPRCPARPGENCDDPAWPGRKARANADDDAGDQEAPRQVIQDRGVAHQADHECLPVASVTKMNTVLNTVAILASVTVQGAAVVHFFCSGLGVSRTRKGVVLPRVWCRDRDGTGRSRSADFLLEQQSQGLRLLCRHRIRFDRLGADLRTWPLGPAGRLLALVSSSNPAGRPRCGDNSLRRETGRPPGRRHGQPEPSGLSRGRCPWAHNAACRRRNARLLP